MIARAGEGVGFVGANPHSSTLSGVAGCGLGATVEYRLDPTEATFCPMRKAPPQGIWIPGRGVGMKAKRVWLVGVGVARRAAAGPGGAVACRVGGPHRLVAGLA